jgi:nitrilase
MTDNKLKVALAQISPVWLNKKATCEKIISSINEAGENGCELIVFGESLLPGYPFWLTLTNGAAFDSKVQKELHAHYVRNSVQIEEGDLNGICKAAK